MVSFLRKPKALISLSPPLTAFHGISSPLHFPLFSFAEQAVSFFHYWQLVRRHQMQECAGLHLFPICLLYRSLSWNLLTYILVNLIRTAMLIFGCICKICNHTLAYKQTKIKLHCLVKGSFFSPGLHISYNITFSYIFPPF